MIFPSRETKTLSQSRLNTLKSCGYKYGFKYLLHHKEPPNKYLIGGIVVHDALDEAFKNKIFDSEKITKIARAKTHGKPFGEFVQDLITRTLPAFEPNKIWNEGMDAEVKLVGKNPNDNRDFLMYADLIWEDPNGVKPSVIIDYKTSQKFVTKHHYFQASAYVNVYEQLYKKKAVFAIYMLRTHTMHIIPTWTSMDFWNYVTGIFSQSEPELLRPNQKTCYAYNSRCPFSNECPYYKYKK